MLARELSSAISAAGYVNFDGNIPVPKSMNKEHEIDWNQKQKNCINPIVNQNNVCEETHEIFDDDDEEDDNMQEEKLSFAEFLTRVAGCYQSLQGN